MADTVSTAIYKMGVEGQESVDAAGASVDRLAVSEEKLTRATRTSADSVDRLLGRLDPRIRAEQQLQAALAQVNRFEEEGIGTAAQRAQAIDAATTRYAQAIQKLNGTSAQNTFLGAGNAAKLSAFQLQNLSFQMQDVGQAIATGQPLFRTLIQQGSQIAQIFGPGVGVAGALKAVGTGLLTYLTNPLNIAVLAFAAAAGAAGTLFNLIRTGGTSAEEALKRHKELIDRITAAYGDAGRAATDYAKESVTAIHFATTQALADEQARLQTALSGFAAGVTGSRQQSLVGFFGTDADQARAAISKFITEIRDGRGNVADFREQLVKLGDASDDPRFRSMIQTWLDNTSALKDLAAQAGQTGRAVSLMAGVRLGPSAAITGQFDTGFGETAGAIAKLREALKALHPKEPSDPQQNQFDAALKATQKQTDALIAQAAALGQGVGASAEYTKQQELLNLAQANHLKLSAADIAGINALAEAYGAATQKLAEMKTARELAFARSQFGRSATEQTVATTLRGIYGDDYQQETNGAIAQQIRLNEQIKLSHDLAVDFVTGFASDLRNGVSAVNALGNAFGRLGDKLLDIALNQAINALFGNLLGGIFGGGSSVLSGGLSLGAGGIGHNAAGNDNWKGGLTRVNENGGEILNLPRGTQIIPHDVSMAMASSSGKASSPNIQMGDVHVHMEGSSGDPVADRRQAREVGETVRGIVREELHKAVSIGGQLNRVA